MFDVESEDKCRYDALYIYDDYYDNNGTMWANLCGNFIPSDFQSFCRTLFLAFRTDGSVTAHGFEIEISFIDSPPLAQSDTFRSAPLSADILSEEDVILNCSATEKFLDCYYENYSCTWMHNSEIISIDETDNVEYVVQPEADRRFHGDYSIIISDVDIGQRDGFYKCGCRKTSAHGNYIC